MDKICEFSRFSECFPGDMVAKNQTLKKVLEEFLKQHLLQICHTFG